MDTSLSPAHLTQYLASGATVLHEEFLEELLKLPAGYAARSQLLSEPTSAVCRVLSESYYSKGGV
jgi:hypothetical protein